MYLCGLNLVNLELYIISFKGLSLGSYVFDWKIDGSFFEMYELSEISDAGIDVQLTLVKHSRYFELNFDFNGWVEVACNRCLDPLKLEIASQAQMFVRFGDHSGEDESDENDVIVLPYGEERLNVAQYLYEYAHLSLPIRRVHPQKDECNAEMLTKLEQFLVN